VKGSGAQKTTGPGKSSVGICHVELMKASSGVYTFWKMVLVYEDTRVERHIDIFD